MWSDLTRPVSVVVAAITCCGSAYSQSGLSFDDRRAQLDAQTELVTKEIVLQDALRRLAVPGQSGLPSILAIMGLEGRYTARLLQPSGVASYFRENETIRPGMVVSAITEKGVIVRIGKGKTARAVALDFTTGASTSVSLPGLPPGAPSGPLPPELLPAPPVVQVGPSRRSQPAAAPAQQQAQAPAAVEAPAKDPISQANATPAATATTAKK